MSIFDHCILRKFYRLIKNYTDDLLHGREEDVEDKVDKIDSRTSRSKLLRREWAKAVKAIREWNASRIKKEVDLLTKRAQGHSGDADQVREDLDDFLTLARYKYLEAINPDIDIKSVDIGPSNMETFLSYYLEHLMQDNMVTSRMFLASSVSDRDAVIRSCMTDAIEESIPPSIHREILVRKSRSKRGRQQATGASSSSSSGSTDPSSSSSGMGPPQLSSSSTPLSSSSSSAAAVASSLESGAEDDVHGGSGGADDGDGHEGHGRNKSDRNDKKVRKRKVKEVVLDDEEDGENGVLEGGRSQMDLLRERLEELERRDRKLREKKRARVRSKSAKSAKSANTAEDGGNAADAGGGNDDEDDDEDDFEANTGLSSFM